MGAEIRRRLHFSLRTIGIYSAAILLFEYVIITTFGSLCFEDLRGLFEAMPPVIKTLLGAQTAALLSLDGYLAIAFVHPVILVLLSAFPIAFAAGALAGEVEGRTVVLILARPVSRRQVVSAAALALAAGVAVMGVALWVGIALWTRLKGIEPVNLAAFGWAAASAAAMFAAVGGYSLLFSALTSEAGRAAGAGAMVTVVMYFLNYLAGLSSQWEPLRRYSLFAYWDPQGIVARGGLRWEDMAVLLGVAAVSMILAVVVFDRRDIAS